MANRSDEHSNHEEQSHPKDKPEKPRHGEMRQRSNANTSAKIWSAEYSAAADTGVVVKAAADQP